MLADQALKGSEIKSIAGLLETDRAAKCSDSLLGVAGDSLDLGAHDEKTFVIYAFSKTLCAQIKENPKSHDFSEYIKIAEAAHDAYTGEDTKKGKRARSAGTAAVPSFKKAKKEEESGDDASGSE